MGDELPCGRTTDDSHGEGSDDGGVRIDVASEDDTHLTILPPRCSNHRDNTTRSRLFSNHTDNADAFETFKTPVQHATSPSEPSGSPSIPEDRLSTLSTPTSIFSSPIRGVTKTDDHLRPTRTKSTPFSHSYPPEQRSSSVCCLPGSSRAAKEPLAGGGNQTEAGTKSPIEVSKSEDSKHNDEPQRGLKGLPIEVQEAILDYLFGYRVSPSSPNSLRATRAWATVMRHSRRKELTQLALVSRTWRTLVQQRLYRHIKLKATVEQMEAARIHFSLTPHVQFYVRHIEVWWPTFHPLYMTPGERLATTLLRGGHRSDHLVAVPQGRYMNAVYLLPTDKCTVEEVFNFVARIVPHARVLTLEGGERKKAPKVDYFRSEPDAADRLPVLGNINILNTRGQWNLIRDRSDYATLMAALPHLTEWQSSFSKAKSKTYITASNYLLQLPPKLANLNLCIEFDHKREERMPDFYVKAQLKSHICCTLAGGFSHLETLTYTGRVCYGIFDLAVRKLKGKPESSAKRLRRVDLTVKNCCRPLTSLHESGSGIVDVGFIDEFEKLVISAVRSLEHFTEVAYIRIRFVDLDSPYPALSPYFLLENGVCSGVWSEAIISEMARIRPSVKFTSLSDTFGYFDQEGKLIVGLGSSQRKLTSLKLANYRALAARITIH